VSSVAYIDTTLRDLATYPWGSSVDADALAAAAQALSAVGAAALEAVDPRCARAGIELRTESPWDRLRAVVRHAGATPVGVVIHGRMLWHDRPVADDVVRRFVLCAVESGARRLRALDPLNDPANLAPAAEACAEAGVEFVPTLVAAPAPAPGDARWREEARALAALPGARSICISDGGGHLGPRGVAELVRAVAEASGLPVEVLVQAPGGLAPILSQAAVEAGASGVYGATGPVAMTAARPSAETLRAALSGTARELAADQEAIYAAARTVGPMLTSDRLAIAASDLFGPAVSLPPDLESALMSRLGRLGMSRNLIQVAEEARAVASEVGAVTFAYPLGDAVVAQAADHVIGGSRWDAMEPVLAAAVLGRLGRPRGPVSEAARAAAEAAGADDAPAPDMEAAAQSAPRGTSDEDLVLLAQFPEATERLVARRRSLRTEVADEEGAQIDRVLLETLIQAVESSADSEVSVELGGARVTVRRSAPAPAAGGTSGAAAAGAGSPDDGMHRITSPMVGTFYRAPSPDADPFVTEGQRVQTGQVLCLIEAMKLFNEITADVDGVVRAMPVENAQGVEFGDVLFVIEPA
jgi:oxaloacetate decarboxylase alpha subunit